MSKLSFRARALDASKQMPVFVPGELPDLPDFAAINRAVPTMPTGMEKEEETEHHLQRALSAQQVYGTAEALVIPIPEVDKIGERYTKLYAPEADFKPPKQYVHVQPWSMDQEIPDYDMDSEDEQWLNKQSKKLECTDLKFETMLDRLEKGSGQTVMTLQEAKALLKEDDDLIIAVYDYWLNKRLRLQHALIHQVKTEKRDGSTTNNPYVAFRRRIEKMQTRKNKKNDEVSYEKMLKVRRDLNRALTILELMKRREKSKKELLKLTIEIVEKRNQMQDWDASALNEAMAQRHKLPPFVPLHYNSRDWSTKEEGGFVSRKKREYKKRKHKQTQGTPPAAAAAAQTPAVHLTHHYPEIENLHPHGYSSDEEGMSPQLSASDHEVEDDPDGIYAFRRKPGVSYHAPISGGHGNWPWHGHEEGGFGNPIFRYSLTSLTDPGHCIGFTRRRLGRGGRVILDRAFTAWDNYLAELDFSNSMSDTGWAADYTSHITENKISHFRPKTPTEETGPSSSIGDSLSPTFTMEFNIESYHNHREQLLQMTRDQQEQLLKQEDISVDLEHSFSSQPTSRFTLDSASAQFAASAVCNTAPDLVDTTNSSTSSHTNTAALANGPVADAKTSGLSTSPAANVLQLNYPLMTPVLSSSSSSSSTQPKSAFSSTSSSSAISTQLSSATISLPVGLNSSRVPVITSKALTTSSPAVLKIASVPDSRKNDTVPKDNRGGANNLIKDNVVAMEVT